MTVIIVLSSILAIGGGCAGGKKYSKDGYEWVPFVESRYQTKSHKEILDKDGKPNAVWKTPFGTYMWVYCYYEVPVRVLFFGEKEMIREGEPSPNRPDLCEEP